jgi:long-chain acyl-CoA synthetase
MHAAIEACCVTGANLGQPLALAMLNVEAARRAADARRPQPSSRPRWPPT